MVRPRVGYFKLRDQFVLRVHRRLYVVTYAHLPVRCHQPEERTRFMYPYT
jgi:hypothetical protein